jgi:hypothetical protein
MGSFLRRNDIPFAVYCERVLQALETCDTQTEILALTGLPKGTLPRAIRALEAAGLIVLCGTRSAPKGHAMRLWDVAIQGVEGMIHFQAARTVVHSVPSPTLDGVEYTLDCGHTQTVTAIEVLERLLPITTILYCRACHKALNEKVAESGTPKDISATAGQQVTP